MTRSNGEFPSYNRIDLDPEEWPDNYWDKALQCTACGTNWPAHMIFQISPCCRFATKPVSDVPDMRWPEGISRLQNARFDRLYENWNEDKSDEQLLIEEELLNMAIQEFQESEENEHDRTIQ